MAKRRALGITISYNGPCYNGNLWRIEDVYRERRAGAVPSPWRGEMLDLLHERVVRLEESALVATLTDAEREWLGLPFCHPRYIGQRVDKC